MPTRLTTIHGEDQVSPQGQVRPYVTKISCFNRRTNHVRYLRQSVTLTGLQTPTFEKILNTIAEIHTLFGRSVGMSKLEECGGITSYKGMPAVELSNRYFTPRNSTTGGDEIPLSADIDPHGYLSDAAGTGLFHSEENTVSYFERHITNGDDYK